MIAEIAKALGEAKQEGKRVVEFRVSPEGADKLRVLLVVSGAAFNSDNQNQAIGEVMGTPMWLASPGAPDLCVVTEVEPLTQEQADEMAQLTPETFADELARMTHGRMAPTQVQTNG